MGKSSKTTSQNKAKGNIVERIVALMHEDNGVKVTSPAYLNGRGRNRTRKREIDVLLQTLVSGYEIKLAIECKNEDKPIGSPKIDSFRGKLLDVGIPVQHGIFVSASGYTQDAIELAKEAGLTTLIFEGLTKDRLESALHEAVQNIIFLLANVTTWTVTRTSPDGSPEEAQVFLNSQGKVVATVQDLFWNEWLFSANIPDVPGTYEIELNVPKWLHQTANGQEVRVLGVNATFKVTGHVIHIPGNAKRHHLLNAASQTLEKMNVQMSFDTSPRIYDVYAFEDEDALNSYLDALSYAYALTSPRHKLPRCIIGPMYWPPSQTALERMKAALEPFMKGLAPDPRPLKFEDIEGRDLSKVFEPVIETHPAVRRSKQLREEPEKENE